MNFGDYILRKHGFIGIIIPKKREQLNAPFSNYFLIFFWRGFATEALETLSS